MTNPPTKPLRSPFPSPEERKAARERKRQALLLAAVKMFNERGFHATSLDDVAATLGVTKPVLYHYLGPKDQILFECVRIGLAELKDAAEQGRREQGSGLERLRHTLIRYAETNMRDFGACVIRTGDELLTPESRREFRKLKRDIDQVVRGLIAEGIADQTIRDTDVRFAAFTLAGALNWPARWYDEEKGTLTPRQIAEKMVDILLHGLAKA